MALSFEIPGDPIVIRAAALSKHFGSTEAVCGIDFSVRYRECFGLLGPNGAGKTTTVRMVHCFIPPTSGTLNVLGLDVLRQPRLIKARLGVCPQENNLDPDLNVWDNLRVFARYFDMTGRPAEQRCEELLHFIGLYQKRHAAIDELSGGIKRRLMMVRSLLNRPELLILDEPTTGLDPQARHQIWETIIRVKEQGTTVLLTTHYMDEAEHLCDKLLIMDRGRIIKEGTPRDLIAQNFSRHVVEISSADPSVIGVLRQAGLAFEISATHCYVSADDGVGTYRFLSDRFGEERCLLRMANLEDVFLKVTGRNLRD
ncbi:MAG: ABC transporter ATP-binding protein [Candidatus Omnitrophica bacterium]|nr:ABC transporter ATP-binding protein [Candidatus Omnitrophota bacterium]